MLLLILKSSVCLAIFMLFYKICLEKTSAHTFKRVYLIGVILFSIGIPFITFTEYIEVLPKTFDVPSIQEYPIPLNIETIEPRKSFQDYVPEILWSIYGIGVLLYAIRFFRNLIQIVQKIRLNPKHKKQNSIIVLLQDLIPPHTFFSFIFLNKTDFENNKIPTEVLLHEQTHAKQKHALDILFIEVLQIIFWFNPLLYLIKKDIKLNHEFLADQAVINNGINTQEYQQLLLAFSSNASHSSLANAINYSLIKKRFKVMKTQTSKTTLWFRSLIVLPLLALLIYGFSQKITIEKPQDQINLYQEINASEGEGATENMIKEYIDFTNQYKKTNRIYNNNHLRSIVIYKMMTNEQRNSVNKPDFRWYNNIKLRTVPRHPTQKLFDEWKNSTGFVFFIDGKIIRTHELNNFTPQDIYSYSNRFAIDNNPENGSYESKRYILLTKKGFELSIQDFKARTYNKLLLEYSKEIEHFLNSDRSNNTELKILKSQLDDLYKELTTEDLNKFNISKASEIPNKSYKKTEKKLSSNIFEYNQLAKKYNDQRIKNTNEFHFKSKELKRLYTLYQGMNKKEKENAESFPYFSNITLERNGIN